MGWRSEKHGPWLLRRLIVDGKVTGLWEREGQIPGAVALAPGTHEIVLEVKGDGGEARSAPHVLAIKAGEIFLCPVDVEKQETSPRLTCGERTGEPVIALAQPEPSGGLKRPRDDQDTQLSDQPRESTPPPQKTPPPEEKRRSPPPPPPPPPQKKTPPPPPPPPPPPDHGRAKLGKVKVMGGEGQVSTDAVLREFKRAKSEIMDCYNRQIKAGNLSKGVILLDFTVWTDGCAAEIEPRVREKRLAPTAQCIQNIVRGFCIDEPRGGPAKVRVPLLFEPAPPEKGRRRR